jgi:hypothetical protein
MRAKTILTPCSICCVGLGLCKTIQVMKRLSSFSQHLIWVLTLAFAFTACDRDPFPLNLQTWDVRWYDDDQNGTQTTGDALVISIRVETTDPDADDQYVREWEFSYYVNDQYAGIILANDNENTNGLDLDLDVSIKNLSLPGPGDIEEGDVVEFRFWARDNCGTEVQQVHRYVVED